MTVDTSVMRDVKSDDSSAFHDDFRLCGLSGMSDPPRTLANACERLRILRTLADALRTLADALRTQRKDLASPPGPLDPNSKTGTLLLRIREKQVAWRNMTAGQVPQLASKAEGGGGAIKFSAEKMVSRVIWQIVECTCFLH